MSAQHCIPEQSHTRLSQHLAPVMDQFTGAVLQLVPVKQVPTAKQSPLPLNVYMCAPPHPVNISPHCLSTGPSRQIVADIA